MTQYLRGQYVQYQTQRCFGDLKAGQQLRDGFLLHGPLDTVNDAHRAIGLQGFQGLFELREGGDAIGENNNDLFKHDKGFS